MSSLFSANPEKHAAYKKAFLENVIKAVKSTAPMRYKALEQTNYSLSSQALKFLDKKGVPGLAPINKGLDWSRNRLSDADTAVGAVLAGKDWEHKPSIRRLLFTDSKENLVEIAPDVYKKFRVPSATAPIKEVAANVVPMWALSKGYEHLDAYRNKDKGVNHEGNTFEGSIPMQGSR